jgi:hypothetical protein
MEWLMKVLHVLAVVVLLGNLLMAPFWRKRLAALGGVQARAAANRSVRVADLIFTLPAGRWCWLRDHADHSRVGGMQRLAASEPLLFLGWPDLWHVPVLRARKA